MKLQKSQKTNVNEINEKHILLILEFALLGKFKQQNDGYTAWFPKEASNHVNSERMQKKPNTKEIQEEHKPTWTESEHPDFFQKIFKS